MAIALASIVLLPTVAHADRHTIVNVGMTLGAKGAGRTDVFEETSLSLVGARVTVAWEHDLLQMPDAPAIQRNFQVVPELVGGSYLHDEYVEGYVGVGLRANLDLAQRAAPWALAISSRGGMYAVGRALVVGGQHDPLYELGIGYYFARFHTATRFGFETTLILRPRDHGITDDGLGAFLDLSVGFGS